MLSTPDNTALNCSARFNLIQQLFQQMPVASFRVYGIVILTFMCNEGNWQPGKAGAEMQRISKWLYLAGDFNWYQNVTKWLTKAFHR